MPYAVASDSDLQTTEHQSNASATLVPVETHETIDSTNTSSNSGVWPDAAILPSVFPQKLCDGIFKYTRGNKHEHEYEVFACVTQSWQQDATQCSLDIGLTVDGASTVAGEIFQKRISYNKDKTVWVLTFDDGVEASMRPGDTFDRAQDLSMKPLLGKLVSTMFDNNLQRRRELKEGNRMTRLLRLTLGDTNSPSKLHVILEAETLTALGRYLWPRY
jgi:hypothetical protein